MKTLQPGYSNMAMVLVLPVLSRGVLSLPHHSYGRVILEPPQGYQHCETPTDPPTKISCGLVRPIRNMFDILLHIVPRKMIQLQIIIYPDDVNITKSPYYLVLSCNGNTYTHEILIWI